MSGAIPPLYDTSLWRASWEILVLLIEWDSGWSPGPVIPVAQRNTYYVIWGSGFYMGYDALQSGKTPNFSELRSFFDQVSPGGSQHAVGIFHKFFLGRTCILYLQRRKRRNKQFPPKLWYFLYRLHGDTSRRLGAFWIEKKSSCSCLKQNFVLLILQPFYSHPRADAECQTQMKCLVLHIGTSHMNSCRFLRKGSGSDISQKKCNMNCRLSL